MLIIEYSTIEKEVPMTKIVKLKPRTITKKIKTVSKVKKKQTKLDLLFARTTKAWKGMKREQKIDFINRLDLEIFG